VIYTGGFLTARSRAQTHVLSEVQALMGTGGKDAIQSMLQSGRKLSPGIFSTLIGVATLAFGATTVFGELRSALNLIWEVKPKGTSGIKGMLRERVFSLGMVVSVGFILLVSLVASAGLAAVSQFFSGLMPIPPFILGVVNFIVSFIGIALLFALILKYVPEATVEWRDVRVGAIATALLFTIGKSLLGVYLGKATPGSAYGAAGSLVVMVIWVYYSAQIFFFGAEFTHVIALARHGKLNQPPVVPLAKDSFRLPRAL
jgi:membrane protein